MPAVNEEVTLFTEFPENGIRQHDSGNKIVAMIYAGALKKELYVIDSIEKLDIDTWQELQSRAKTLDIQAAAVLGQTEKIRLS
jgi:hypothetical protein